VELAAAGEGRFGGGAGKEEEAVVVVVVDEVERRRRWGEGGGGGGGGALQKVPVEAGRKAWQTRRRWVRIRSVVVFLQVDQKPSSYCVDARSYPSLLRHP